MGKQRVTPRVVAMTLAVIVGASPIPHAAAGTVDTRVRVNQVGYITDGPKRAFVISSAGCAGVAFELRDDVDAAVLTGTAGEDGGSWNATYGHVCPVGFNGATTPGSYTLVAGGARSPAFRIDDAASLYGPLVANALTFYLGQRDGADVDPGVLDRKPSHLHDRRAMTYAIPDYRGERLQHDLRQVGGPIDVEGGWFDAGDYVKFTGTTSFAVTVMLRALRDHPGVFGGGGPNFDAEARHGVRWLLKMLDARREILYYQVGIGSGGSGISGDHDVWRLPEKDDGFTQPARRYLAHRPALRIAPPGTKVPPSLAGRLAAAFGLCAQVWSGTALADRCLVEGQVALSMAKTKHVGGQITSSPTGYYREDEWRDDLELGAIELYLATSQPALRALGVAPRSYLRRAASWARAYRHSPFHDGDTFNLYDVSAIAHVDLARAIEADGGSDLDVTVANLRADLRSQLDPRWMKSDHDPFAFGAYPWDPVPHAFGLVSAGLAFDELFGTSRYADLARSQADWALGANAWGTSFVVGAGTTFPFCMQHQIANLRGSTDGSAPLLAGATVDGPSDYIPGAGFFGNAVACPPGGNNPFAPFDRDAWRYIDRVQSWSTVEPSLDYTAMSFYAFVMLADA
ncbi:MAG: glycoside hydrolase family 9 protein [Actinomycetota bacterium]